MRGNRKKENQLRQLLRQRLSQPLHLEPLEDRRMMAGPQLVGILPDDGHLLQANETLDVAPLDLTFRFDENQVLDFNTVTGVQIWRAGNDGVFTPASAISDFNTNNAVQLTFAAKSLGTSQNGIQIVVAKSDFGGIGLPTIAVNGNVITATLNTNFRGPSTAQDLVTALNADATASSLVSASITSGSGSTNIAAPAVNFSPLTLTGANAASAMTDLSTSNAVKFRFIATTAGSAGNGVNLVFTKANLGVGAQPVIAVSGQTITVQLNNTTGSKTRASELVNALNNNTLSSALLRASIIGGNATTDVATNVPANTTVTLGGANDVLLNPGFIGRGESDREIIARFKDRLVDDRYHIDIFGSTSFALKNDQGEVFNGGRDVQREFELDLGALVLAVVPQPIDRLANGTLNQRRNQVDVYFNEDDLYPTAVTTGQIAPNPSVVNPAFYRLIYTRDTVENTDDTTYLPTSVSYDPTLNKATLTFSSNLDSLPTGAGTFRLRIGTSESNPLAPQQQSPTATVSSDLNTGNLVNVRFDSVTPGEAGGGAAVTISRANLGLGVAPVVTVYGNRIYVVVNNSPGSQTTAQQLVNAINANAAANQIVKATIVSGDASANVAAANATPLSLQLVWNSGQGSSFDTAADLGVLSSTGVIYSSAIDPQVYTLDFPGDNQEPGHRDINITQHVPDAADTTAGITTVRYNFRSLYGFDPQGNALSNLITENQKQRAREIFQQISEVSGIQFIETADQGLAVVTGDMRSVNPFIPTGAGYPYSVSGTTAIGPAVVLEAVEAWDDSYGGTWFQRAYHEIGSVLGLGGTYDLPPGNVMGQDGPVPTTNPLTNVNSSQQFSNPGLQFDNAVEPVFPGAADIVHLQRQFRPESKDIDMYKFTLTETGEFTAETIAERRFNSSQLDTALRLYKLVDIKDSNGVIVGQEKQLVSQNDDYFSKDSYIKMTLEPGTYWVGVSASGNTSYDPTIEDSGIGGTSQGQYDLRFNFRPQATETIVDATGVKLDGDGDGTPGGVFNFWFRAQTPANTIYVDKSAAAGGTGTLASPRNNLATALASAQPGQIVRVLGNNGTDGVATTLGDNAPYEIGFNSLGSSLTDGSTLDVPKGVTVMVDAGAIFKMRRSAVNVGSTSATIDRSGGALQILGTPSQNVYFTSYDDAVIGRDTNPDTVLPQAGNWGGLAFRNDVDATDPTRLNYESRGIFLNYVSNADIRYGGGTVVVASVAQVVNPIHMVDARPTVIFNTITRSADAAMSASPNSFQEDNFHSPPYQFVSFTSDYDRVGPDIHGNALIDAAGNANSINGLLVRVRTPAGNTLRKLTVPARFDDRDIVHVLNENLVIEGTPGGPVEYTTKPSLALTTTTRLAGGGLASFTQGTYNYKLTFVDASGNEALASNASTTTAIQNGDRIRLANIPAAPAGFTQRRLYRSDATGGGTYTLVAQLNGTDTTYTDIGTTAAAVLVESGNSILRPRLDARLAIDPAIMVKLSGASISTNMGGQLIAEAQDGLEAVFTSLGDDRYGAGGTFQTRNDGQSNTVFDAAGDPNAPRAGDWAGLFIGPYSSASLDNVVIAGAGGVTRVEGTFTAFNPVEIHQSDARITNSTFEYNENGLGGQAPAGRFGRGFNEAASIFVRGAQPVILGNTLQHNQGPAISINANAVTSTPLADYGRTTGDIDRTAGFLDNQGPLIRQNRLGDNAINGMVVRGETLTTESVWDDTDIVHVLLDTIYVYDFHTYGGLRLESNPGQSLVIKSQSQDAGGNNPNVPDAAGIVVNGRPLEIDDRIGGTLQVLGLPGFPVVMTSITDDSVGAGLQPDGSPQVDTNNGDSTTGGGSLLPTGPEVNNGTLIDNDVPVNTVGHFEVQPGAGGDIINSGVTMQGTTQLLVNQNYIFAFRNYIDVGSNGGAVNLGATTITQAPTLVSPDLVISRGTFAGANGTVNWEVETRLDNGVAIVYNTLRLSSTNALGNVRYISYLDEDVLGISDDLLYTTGTPGQADFRAFTLDNAERVGFAHGGFYVPSAQLVNATYDGWAADAFPDLNTAITGAGATFSVAGNIDTTDLTPFTDAQLGQAYGLADITTAFAWSADPTSNSSVMTSFLELVPRNPGTDSNSGDWSGIDIDQYANDRNVAAVTENEAASTNPAGRNGTPSSAQYLGELGAYEKQGDENLRLGFTVQGTIANRGDIDVYSFKGTPGTPVWIDLDRTWQALDSVVELIDESGNILVLSDSSGAETLDPTKIYTDGVTKASPLTETEPDRYTVNPRDAGFKVVLPGQGDSNTYHIRVRSSNLASGDAPSKLLDPAQLGGGLTAGAYQLQIRLRELDEVAGTAVRYSDIRYAETGITVTGQPTHSPLLGEAAETTNANNTLGQAQNLGNLLTSDRGALSVAGNIAQTANPGTDVDWYQLDVTYSELETATSAVLAATFDIDYADGMARPDTMISIYDSNGRLIYTSTDSNIQEDQAQPLGGANVSDLNRGSVGALDPFAGSINLVTGTYFVAITSKALVPEQLGQFVNRLPSNPLLRLEPNTSVVRIAEDHINAAPNGTAQAPLTPDLLNASSAVPYNLGDVVLFVSYDNNFGVGIDQSTLATFNPFTGQLQTIVNNNQTPGGFYNFDVGDIAMRSDGRLYGFSLDVEDAPIDPNGPTDAESGNLININTGTGVATVIADDEINTFIQDPADPTAAIPAGINDEGVGVQFQAVTFTPASLYGAERLLAVGYRPDENQNNGVPYKRNILYRFTNDVNSATNLGVAVPNPDNDRARGAGTDAMEIGRIITGGEITAVDATIQNPNPNAVYPNITVFQIPDAATFTINDGFQDHVFEMDAGPEVLQNVNETAVNQSAARTVRDGNFFVLDPDVTIVGDESLFQFDTGPVIVVNNASSLVGQTLSVNGAGGATETFEFVAGGKPVNPNATAVDISGNLTATGVAGFIRDAINAGTSGVTAAAVGNRVTLVNDNFAQSSTTNIQIVGNRGLASILEAVPGSAIADGQVFRLQFSGGTTYTFEFDNGAGGVTPGNIRVPFFNFQTAAQVATSMQAAIAGSGAPIAPPQLVIDPAAGYGRVVVSGQGMTYLQATSQITDMVQRLSPRTFTVNVEENFTAAQVGAQVEQVVNTATRFTASADLGRINFPPPKIVPTAPLLNRIATEDADFLGVPVWVDQGSTFGVATGHTAVPFFASDSAAEIARQMTAAVNLANIPGVTASQNGSSVVVNGLLNGSITAPAPFSGGGNGPGGVITGMASVGGSLYVVTDNGGLYSINPDVFSNITEPAFPSERTVPTTYISSSVDDLLGIRFAGLTAGPQSVENGRYSNILFATDFDGRLYAFNTQGVLQPVFVDGQTSIDMGVSNIPGYDGSARGGVQGIAFSTLDRNLWGITPNAPVVSSATPMDVRVGAAATVGSAITVDARQTEIGHGINATYDTVRDGELDPNTVCNPPPNNDPYPQCGLASYHFGLGRVGDVPRTYDFPGGAQGSLITEEFSLKGYAAADQPVLYFTYHSDNQDANAANVNYDSLRVFVGGDDGQWTLVNHNDNGAGGTLFDNTGSWRQARIDLSGFAGQEHLKLRLDFSSAGDMNLGDPNTTGSELWAVAGSLIADGQTFQIDNEIFEFDLGYTVIPPSGAAIVDGEMFTITDGAGQSTTYEFDSDGLLSSATNVRILIDAKQTAADMARLIDQAVRLNGPSNVTPFVSENRVNLQGAQNIVQTLAPGESQLALVLDGSYGTNPTYNPVVINQAMTSTQVASAIDAALESTFHSQTIIASSGVQYDDGDSFQLSDGQSVVNFEFDSGYVLTLPATGGQGILDGDSITIYQQDQNRSVTIEFNKTGGVTPGNIAVNITDAASTLTVASAIRQAILNAAGTTPAIAALGIANPQVISGSRLQLGGVTGVLVEIRSAGISVLGTPGVSGAVELQVPGALGIRVPGSGGPIIRDGESFVVSDGTNNVTFELDSNGVVTPGRIAITYPATLPAGTPAVIAAQIANAIQSEVTLGNLIGLSPTVLVGTNPLDVVVDLGSNSTHSVTMTNTILSLEGRAGGVVDGETFTLGDGARTFTFEMNSVGTTLPGNIAINYLPTDDPDAIAANIRTAIQGVGLTGYAPTVSSLGRVQLGETTAAIVNTAGLVNIVRSGAPGDAVQAIAFSPSATFSANNIATALAAAINNSPLNVVASVNAASQRRVTLSGADLTLQLNGTAVTSSVDPPLSFEAPVDVVKQYKNMVRIIGHTVNDAGPLGLADNLPNDVASDPNFLRQGFNGNQRGQANQFEGIYLDDFIIGFAERGEMVTGANTTTNFVVNPALSPTDILSGPYQLEVRRSDEYATAGTPSSLFKSIDTNDRQSNGVTLIAQAGSRLSDGQTFGLRSGAAVVTFEYDDASILDGNPARGVAPGNVALRFDPSDPDYVVAAMVRDAINSPEVQAVLSGVSAALADGTDGVVRTGPSTSNRIDIFGSVTLIKSGTPVPEANDTIATATATGIVGLNSPNFKASGVIGDNPNFPLQKGRDVDIFQVFLNAGETLTIDVDAAEIGSTLNPVLAVFNAQGAALAFNDTARGPGELASADAFLTFTPAIAGNYYVGVSGNNGTPVIAPFSVYNPNIEGSNNPGSTGFYELQLTFGDPARADFEISNSFGDQNRVRDQGQIILEGNRISNSAGFGIDIQAGPRDPVNGQSHQGPVRQLSEINFDRLAPGVVVMNNLLSNNIDGGIRMAGDTGLDAPVPFGRVINNTIFGRGGDLLATSSGSDIGIVVEDNASPTLLNNIVANAAIGIQVDAGSSSTVVGGSVYQGNLVDTAGVATENFPLYLANTDPLFINALQGNFYLAKGSVAIDSAVDSLLERASLQTVKAPLGIPPSPILAPERDLYGLLRVDDPATSPAGFGENVFKDRGAVDRADFAGPAASLVNPRDEIFTGSPPASSTPNDQNGSEGFIQLPNMTLYDFSIQLNDGVEPADPVNGVGVDDTTVTKDKLIVVRDNQLLTEGLDYTFSYDATNNVIHLKPLAGVWDVNRVYVIDLVNRDQFTFASPDGSQVVEGQTFTVSDATTTTTFEFDSGFVLQVPTSGVSDAQKFTIRNGINAPVTFEFDRNNSITPGNVRIALASNSTQNDIANAIVSAVAGVASLGLSPINSGSGKVWLGGTVNHQVTTTGSSLTVSGAPGAQTAGAVPVPFVPGVTSTTPAVPIMSADQLATSITTAIQNSGLAGVRASWRAFSANGTANVEVVIRGATDFSGFTSTYTPAIKDLAANDLKANLITGETTFTVFLGNGVDYGDAPSPYPTTTTDAASHAIVSGLGLGAAVDAEPGGQPSTTATGDDVVGSPDDEDGVIFNTSVSIGGTVTITVTAMKPGAAVGSLAGYLDGFVDFNRDGDWDDATDRIFASRALNVGANTLTFNVPTNASLGNSFARFRFSSTGGLSARGAAGDGEVEDYQVTIGGPPWQNSTRNTDVNNDGHVTPLDALLVVNFLNTYPGVSALPNPPPFVPFAGTPIYPDNPGTGSDFFIDVNGDGFVTPLDALLVINLINTGGGGEGEAASVDSVVDVLPASLDPAVLASLDGNSANVGSSTGGSAPAATATRSTTVDFVFPVVSRSTTETEDDGDLARDWLLHQAADDADGLDALADDLAYLTSEPSAAEADDRDDYFTRWA
ncbi:MAG: dockerin type I domain-containing protein [Pirellulales bacterium]